MVVTSDLYSAFLSSCILIFFHFVLTKAYLWLREGKEFTEEGKETSAYAG